MRHLPALKEVPCIKNLRLVFSVPIPLRTQRAGADDSFIICFGFTIIPRAAAAFFQEGAGAVFGEENTGGVDGAAHEDMPALHFFAERRKNGRHAINGEHPDGRLAGHFFVFFSAQRATSGP